MRTSGWRAGAGALALVAGLLGGCSPPGGGAGDGPVRLSFQSLAWQKESVDANKALVAAWNAAHPEVQVRYVQGSWSSVHDQLLTSFEGGEAPDVIHDASDDLADFAHGGYLADLRPLLSDRLRTDIPAASWESVTFGADGGVYGVPFLQEPRVLMANTGLLRASGSASPPPKPPGAGRSSVRPPGSSPARAGTGWPGR